MRSVSRWSTGPSRFTLSARSSSASRPRATAAWWTITR
ncbi:hypothetical protein LTDYDHKI_CDS0003 [Exiguobacterium phage phiExGM16]